MTVPPPVNGHADLEALSAFLDGEAPEWASHVEACEACRATVGKLRGVRAMLGAPVDPVDPARRDDAVAAAVAAATAGAARTPGRSAPPTRQPLRWLVPASIAALFAVVVGAVSLVGQGGRSADEVTTAGPALESAPPADSTARGGGGGAAARVAPDATSAGHLGEVADAATLLERARPGLVARDSAALSAPPAVGGSGEISGDSASGAGGGTSAGSSRSSATSTGSPATLCEQQARSREPRLEHLVYFATATRQGVPAVVLGFSTGPGPAPVTLLLLAQDGCGVLLRAAGP